MYNYCFTSTTVQTNEKQDREKHYFMWIGEYNQKYDKILQIQNHRVKKWNVRNEETVSDLRKKIS